MSRFSKGDHVEVLRPITGTSLAKGDILEVIESVTPNDNRLTVIKSSTADVGTEVWAYDEELKFSPVSREVAVKRLKAELEDIENELSKKTKQLDILSEHKSKTDYLATKLIEAVKGGKTDKSDISKIIDGLSAFDMCGD